MYALVYRENSHNKIKAWPRVFKDVDSAEKERVDLCRTYGWQVWRIFFDDPR